jgi:hypothetical protein
VLIDQENNTSLIAIFNELRRPSVPDIPANAQAPIRWNILTLWYRESSDVGHRFEQRAVLFAPDGTVTVDSRVEFDMSEGQMHRNVTTVFGFPISQIGQYSLSLRLKRIAEPGEGSEISSFPIFVGIDEVKT